MILEHNMFDQYLQRKELHSFSFFTIDIWFTLTFVIRSNLVFKSERNSVNTVTVAVTWLEINGHIVSTPCAESKLIPWTESNVSYFPWRIKTHYSEWWQKKHSQNGLEGPIFMWLFIQKDEKINAVFGPWNISFRRQAVKFPQLAIFAKTNCISVVMNQLLKQRSTGTTSTSIDVFIARDFCLIMLLLKCNCSRC